MGQFFTSVKKPLQVCCSNSASWAGAPALRDEAQRNAVLEAIARYPGVLKLAGVELYEGVLKEEHEVREFLQGAVAVTRSLVDARTIRAHAGYPVGRGFGMVRRGRRGIREGVGNQEQGSRSCCVPARYLTHDVGIYRKAQTDIFARNPVAKKMGEGFQPALQLWAYVQSIPEPDRAIIGC